MFIHGKIIIASATPLKSAPGLVIFSEPSLNRKAALRYTLGFTYDQSRVAFHAIIIVGFYELHFNLADFLARNSLFSSDGLLQDGNYSCKDPITGLHSLDGQ